jgi:competence protein ComEA
MPLGRAHLAVVALVSVAALAGTVVVLVSAQPREQAVPLAASPEATPTASPPTRRAETAPAAPAAASQETVMVHVVGQVHRAGVVAVPGGSRVVDALEAVGGPTADADLTTVNLARLVRDGEQIRVGLPPDPSVAQGSGGGGAPLDLNAASAAELEELPGVGPVLADRIVAYRDESGPFRSVEQLIEVPGIGPAVLGSLDGRVKV